MDSTEAKLLFSVYRDNGKDANDPHFKEALELLEKDPELQEWLKKERAIDQSIRKQLQHISPPEDLKQSILTAHNFCQNEKENKSNLIPFYPLIGVAAALALALFIWKPNSVEEPQPKVFAVSEAEIITQPDTQFQKASVLPLQTINDKITAILASDFSLGLRSSKTEKIEHWLKGKKRPYCRKSCKRFAKNKAVGCQSFDIDGSPASLVCYVTDKGNWVHLFILPNNVAEDLKNSPEFVKKDKWTMAQWKNKYFSFYLAHEGSEETLKNFL